MILMKKTQYYLLFFIFLLVFFNNLFVIKGLIDLRLFFVAWLLFLLHSAWVGFEQKTIVFRWSSFYLGMFVVACFYSTFVLNYDASSKADFLQLVYYVSIYVILSGLFLDERVREFFSRAVLYAVPVFIASGLMSYFFDVDVPPVVELFGGDVGYSSGLNLRGARASSLGLGAVLTALVSVVSIFFILQNPSVPRNLKLIICLLLGVVVFLTDSRAGMLTLVAVSFYVFSVRFFGVGLMTAVVFLIFPISVGYIGDFWHWIMYRDGVEDVSTLYHLAVWDSAFHIFKENQFFGIGLGGFVNHWVVPGFHDFYNISFSDIDPHNILLLLLSETGLFGSVFFLLFVVSVLVEGRLYDRDNALFMAVFLALIMMNLTMNAFMIELFWVVLARLSVARVSEVRP